MSQSNLSKRTKVIQSFYIVQIKIWIFRFLLQFICGLGAFWWNVRDFSCHFIKAQKIGWKCSWQPSSVSNTAICFYKVVVCFFLIQFSLWNVFLEISFSGLWILPSDTSHLVDGKGTHGFWGTLPLLIFTPESHILI